MKTQKWEENQNQKMLATLVGWLRTSFNWHCLKCLEIIVQRWITQIPNTNRYLLSIYVQSGPEVFQNFSSVGFWSLGEDIWCFNVISSLSLFWVILGQIDNVKVLMKIFFEYYLKSNLCAILFSYKMIPSAW